MTYAISKNKRSQMVGSPQEGGTQIILAVEELLLELECPDGAPSIKLEVEIKRHDIEPAIVLLVTNGGVPFDFTGYTIPTFIMRKVDAEPGDISQVVLPGTFGGIPSAGKLVYSWTTGDTNTCGTFRAEFETANALGRKRTFPGTNNYIKVTIPEDLNEI